VAEDDWPIEGKQNALGLVSRINYGGNPGEAGEVRAQQTAYLVTMARGEPP
jgi:hypothetical protein